MVGGLRRLDPELMERKGGVVRKRGVEIKHVK